ncbi:acyltransferase [Phycicoccus sp. HDW14]|uniref:acyltransferase family protein n=1 Tax=Phycicoccus sp. HDW14 TaxID=2714941 RepID=UPI00140BC2F7|nr:acyltransferase [Phycicoccus sp. HDW14]QIM20973.1 acyltransferase [Phycicoccus sp. HDW14]
MTRLPALDGLRAVAAALVVLTHAAFLTGTVVTGGLPGRLMGRGDFGVDLFFALSGFLLHQRLLHDRREGVTDVRSYLLRRAARVLPAYWVALAAVVAVTLPPVRTVVAEVLAVQTYVPGAQIDAFSQSWSIPTELAFYVALPAVAVGLERLRVRDARWPVPALVVSALVPLVVLALLPPAELGVDVLVERWLPFRWADFAVGMVLAEVAAHPGSALARRVRAVASDTTGCLVVGAATFALATTAVAGPLTLGSVSGPQISTRILLGALFALALLAPLTVGDGGAWADLLARGPVRWVGTVSFGLFLWHLPVLTGLLALSGLPVFRGGFVPLLVVGVPVSLTLAWLSLRLVELPAMRWAARRSPLPRVPHRG